jgi:hypothetical protein
LEAKYKRHEPRSAGYSWELQVDIKVQQVPVVAVGSEKE